MAMKGPLLHVGIVIAIMLLFGDVTASNNQQLSPDVVAGLMQQAYLRGNTDVSGTKKEAVVTEEMHVGDLSSDTIFFEPDYADGTTPGANCKHKWECPRRP